MSEELLLIGKGAAVGLAVSAPVGPIGIMCIGRTLSHGPRWGLAVGLGAVTADMIYASAAAFGVGALSRLLLPWEVPLRLLAAAIVAGLAVRAFRATATAPDAAPAHSVAGTYGTSFALVFTNPAAIAIFTGVFIGLGLTSVDRWSCAIAIVSGVVIGAFTWWVVLTGSVTVIRSRVNDVWLRRINIASGTALAVIGTLILITTLR